VKDVEIGFSIGGECDWDVLRYRPRIHVNDSDHATHQISDVSFVDVINVAFSDRDWHQEGRS
jgi:hypothetical protein